MRARSNSRTGGNMKSRVKTRKTLVILCVMFFLFLIGGFLTLDWAGLSGAFFLASIVTIIWIFIYGDRPSSTEAEKASDGTIRSVQGSRNDSSKKSGNSIG